MKNRVYMIFMLAVTLGLTAQAQDQNNNEVLDVELQKEIIQETAVPAGSQTVIVNQPVQPNPQAQPQQQPAYQAQPTTFVEASPLVRSRADDMRKMRQEAEIQTEQKIVEKLESSRLDDEKRRADALFGNKNLNAPAPQVQPAPVQQVAPMGPPAPSAEEIADVIKSELKADLAALKKPAKKKKKSSKMYVSGNVGMGDYVDAQDFVESKLATGFTVGAALPSNFTVEGSFMYSRYDVGDDFYYRELTQYNIGAGAKYSPLIGSISPYVGGLVSYTMRRYEDPFGGWGYSPGFGFNEEEATTAFDMGFNAGVDFRISDNFWVGLDYRFMTNVSNQYENNWNMYYSPSFGQEQFIEEEDYQFTSISAKFLF